MRIPEDNVLYKNNDQDSINEYLECFNEGELPCNGGITFADEYPYCLYNFKMILFNFIYQDLFILY